MTISIRQSKCALISNQDLLLLQNYNRLKAAIAAAEASVVVAVTTLAAAAANGVHTVIVAFQSKHLKSTNHYTSLNMKKNG